VITDQVGMTTDSVWAVVSSTTDYYTFGLAMQERSIEDSLYRYGFNGKEKDPEVKQRYDFGERIMDPSTGRFLSLDKFAPKYPGESAYSFASNNPISAIDINGDSTHIIVYGAGYLNYKTNSHNVGDGFMLNARALKKKIESSSTFDPKRDEVIIVYAPNTARFIKATNTKYKSGKIASMTVFSHGYSFSTTNGTNTGGVSLGGEKPGERRPDGTTVTTAEADAQKANYDLREINGNTVTGIDGSNFESTATATFYGCWIGGDQTWSDSQIKRYSFGQHVANTLKIRVKAFTSSGLFKTDSQGKNVYDGTMIRAIDAKSQKTKLSIFKHNASPTIIRK
jgi:RHS repeat-associated protein